MAFPYLHIMDWNSDDNGIQENNKHENICLQDSIERVVSKQNQKENRITQNCKKQTIQRKKRHLRQRSNKQTNKPTRFLS